MPGWVGPRGRGARAGARPTYPQWWRTHPPPSLLALGVRHSSLTDPPTWSPHAPIRKRDVVNRSESSGHSDLTLWVLAGSGRGVLSGVRGLCVSKGLSERDWGRIIEEWKRRAVIRDCQGWKASEKSPILHTLTSFEEEETVPER